ncbi:MAG: CCA tRNA nucleotidyltransferase [Neomegalonema sp.]
MDTPSAEIISAEWLTDPEIRSVVAALETGGATARFVGGCVRNAFLAAGATDVDIAVDVAPEETTRLLEAAGIKAVPTGIEHGTITAVASHHGYEITSLRRDVETDGRRAVVAFTKDWSEDAMRRDFTMNALYADIDGRVYDPLGDGLSDLKARRVRFIGLAEDRIREDYLRILRFFRFTAWYGDAGIEDADLASITRLKDGVAKLARERIGHEVRKLLTAPSSAHATERMAAAGVLAIVLPGASVEGLERLEGVEAAIDEAPSWIRRLKALGGGGAEVVGEALRLSKAEVAELNALARATTMSPGEAGYRLGARASRDALILSAAARGLSSAEARNALPSEFAQAERGAAAEFPLSAKDLIADGLSPGPGLGAALRRAEQHWIGDNFALDRDQLLRHLRED